MPAQWTGISIHALLAESDFPGIVQLGFHPHFYPRSPCGERQTCQIWAAPAQNFYPRSPCGERQCRVRRTAQPAAISIHALLAESDGTMRLPQPWEAISIHALLAESDGQTGGYRTARMSFLSTLSLRRATNTLRGLRRCTANFYPRSPCGERPQAHAPGRPAETFLSTLSLRRATLEDVAQRVGISYFYPRSPCGERLDSAL